MHEQLMLLLRGCKLTVKSGNSDIFSATKFKGFIDHSLPAIEFSIFHIQKTRLHVLWIGAYKASKKRFNYNDQTLMERNGQCGIPQHQQSKASPRAEVCPFWYSSTLSNTETVHCKVAAKQIPSTPPPTDKGSCCVINTPVQLQLGASIIHETINLEKDFPYLHKLGLKVKTDWNIQRLQHEMDKLVDTIKSVTLAEIVLGNNCVWTCILVPRCKILMYLWGLCTNRDKGNQAGYRWYWNQSFQSKRKLDHQSLLIMIKLQTIMTVEWQLMTLQNGYSTQLEKSMKKHSHLLLRN